MLESTRLTPIYTSRRDFRGFLQYPHLSNPEGEWVAIRPPARVPSALLMEEISQNLSDVLDEVPDLQPPMGFDLLQYDID